MSAKKERLQAELTAIQENWGNNPTVDYEHFQKLQGEYRQCIFNEYVAAGDYGKALTLCGSEEVAGVLVSIAPHLTDEQLANELREEWTRCEAHRPYRQEFVQLFRRAGFIHDLEDVNELPVELTNGANAVTIFRGNLGEPEPDGIAWTLSEPQAYFFANHAMSVRGQFLGLYRPDGRPTVWTAIVDAKDVLAYFNGRDEKEVVVDPAAVRGAAIVAQAYPGGRLEINGNA